MRSPEAILQTLSNFLEEFESAKTSPNTIIIDRELLAMLDGYIPNLLTGKFMQFKGKFLKVIVTDKPGFLGVALSFDTVCLEDLVN